MSKHDLAEIQAAIEKQDEFWQALKAKFNTLKVEEPQLPLWDDRVQTDDVVAWRYVGGHKIVVDLSNADLLADANGNQGRGMKTSLIGVEIKAKSNGKSYVSRVSRAGKSFGSFVLKRANVLPPSPKHTVEHIDNDPLNNRLDNLEWLTLGEQSRRRRVHGKSKFLYVTVYDNAAGNGQNTYTYARASVRGPDSKRHIGKNHRVDLVPDAEIAAARDGDRIALSLFGPGVRTNVSLGLLPPLEQFELPLLEAAE